MEKANPVDIPKSVLLLEDDEGVATLTKQSLESSGYLVEVGQDGREVLEKFRNGRFDIVVLDFAVPDMTGIEVFSEMKRILPTVVAVMVTGLGDEEVAVKALQLGMYDYIVKEVNLAHLKTLPHVIEGALDRERSRLEQERLKKQIEERNQELERLNLQLGRQLRQLESAQKITVGRELDMIALKREINALLKEMGRPDKFILPHRPRSGSY